MDLDALLAAYPADHSQEPRDRTRPHQAVAGIVSTLGGISLDGGLYRVFRAAETEVWSATAHRAFPDLAGRATVFAADWLGRLFAADTGRVDAVGTPLVLMLEPGTGEALEVPVSVETLHTTELIAEADAALAASFYEAWRGESGDTRPLSTTECVGYRVPLFLGGADEVSNLERTDMDVYWTLSAQMRHRATGLPPGTPIRAVEAQPSKQRLFRRK